MLTTIISWSIIAVIIIASLVWNNYVAKLSRRWFEDKFDELMKQAKDNYNLTTGEFKSLRNNITFDIQKSIDIIRKGLNDVQASLREYNNGYQTQLREYISELKKFIIDTDKESTEEILKAIAESGIDSEILTKLVTAGDLVQPTNANTIEVYKLLMTVYNGLVATMQKVGAKLPPPPKPPVMPIAEVAEEVTDNAKEANYGSDLCDGSDCPDEPDYNEEQQKTASYGKPKRKRRN